MIAVCPIVDQRWGKLQALIILLSTTGMRIGNALKDLRWANADLESRTVFVPGTKNGEPLTATLPQRTVEALSQLPKGRLENFSLRCR